MLLLQTVYFRVLLSLLLEGQALENPHLLHCHICLLLLFLHSTVIKHRSFCLPLCPSFIYLIQPCPPIFYSRPGKPVLPRPDPPTANVSLARQQETGEQLTQANESMLETTSHVLSQSSTSVILPNDNLLGIHHQHHIPSCRPAVQPTPHPTSSSYSHPGLQPFQRDTVVYFPY